MKATASFRLVHSGSLAALLAALVTMPPAHALTYIWANSNVAGTPAASLNWFGTPQGIWSGGTPLSDNSNIIQFFQDATTALTNTAAGATQTVALDDGGTPFQLGTLTLSGKASASAGANLAMTLAGDPLNFSAPAGTLTLEGVNATRTLTYNLNCNIQLGTASNASALTLQGTGTAALIISGMISELLPGGGSLAKTGPCSVTLAGANTYTGATNVTAGTLALQFGAAVGDGLIASSSALTLGDGTLGVLGSSTALIDTQTFSGTTLAGGYGTIALTKNSATSIAVDLGTLTNNSRAYLNIALPTGTSVTASHALDHSAALLGTWASVGSGTSLAYAADNNATNGSLTAYAGATPATSADLSNMTSATTNYKYSAATVVAGNVTGNSLQYTGGATTTALGSNSLALNGLLNSGSGVLTLTGSAGNAGLVTGASGELDITSNTQGLTIAAVISGAGAVVYGGPAAGTLTLNGDNTYQGDTIINSGTLTTTLGSGKNFIPNGAGKGNLFLGRAGSLGIPQTTETINGLNGSGTVNSPNGGGSTLILGDGNASGNFSGILKNTGAALSLIKIGSGTQTLTGANTYTGTTTVNGGILALDFNSSNPPGILPSTTPLTLGGAGLTLTGNHTATTSQTLASLTLNAGNSVLSIDANGGSGALLALGAITRNATSYVDFTLPAGTQSAVNGITTSTPLGANGILGTYATVGSDWAAKSGNNIVGLSTLGTYSDIAALGSSIADGPTANVRINSAGAGGSIALGAPLTNINTLLQNSGTATSVDASGKTLQISGIMLASGNAALTLGTAPGSGTLTGATSGGELILINNNPAAFLTINAGIANNGTTPLTKLGPGTVVLAGTSTYTGATTVAAGTLSLSGSLSGTAITVNPGATLTESSSGTIGGAKALTVAGTVTLNGANTYSGTTTVNSGTLTLGGTNTCTGATLLNGGTLVVTNPNALQLSTVTFNGGTLDTGALGVALGGITTNGNVTVNSPKITGYPTWSAAAGATLTLSGVITRGTAAAINFATTGSISGTPLATLLGTNTVNPWASFGGTDWAIYNGTTIAAYTGYNILAGASPTLASSAAANDLVNNVSTGNPSLAAAGTTDINSLVINDSTARTVDVRNGATQGVLRLGATGGCLMAGGAQTIGVSATPGTLTSGGADNTAGELTFLVGPNGATVNSVIADNGSGKVSLTKSGAGNLNLGAANTYSGDTTINSGNLSVTAANILPNGPGKGNVFIGASGNLDTGNNVAQTLNGLNGSGTVFRNGYIGPLTLGAGNADGYFSGPLRNGGSGTLALIKTGSGTQTLAGTNSYTGPTTLTNGTLRVDGTHSGGGAYTVTAAATLGGSGTISAAVSAAGTLAPGSGIGTLTVGNTVITGTYACEIDGPSADRLAAGTLNITGATVAFSILNAHAPSAASYVIATYSGTLGGSFTSTTLPAGYTLDYSTPGQIRLLLLGGGYTAWAALNAGGQAADLDYDHDGVSNGVEYFMGKTGSSFTANPGVVGGKVTWPRDPAAIASFKVQVSTNLMTWTDVVPPDASIDESVPTQVTYTLPLGAPRQFCRLVVMP